MPQVAGFQDYARLPTQTGIEIAFFSFTNKGVAGSTGSLDLGGYGYINVSINDFSNPGFWKVSFDWYSDQAATVLVAEQLFIPMPAGQESFQLPCLARWLVIRTAPVSGGPSGSTNYHILGTNAYSPSLYGDKYVGPLVSNFSNIGAGVTSTITATQTHGGRAHLTIGQAATANWTGFMEFFDYVSTLWQRFWMVGGSYPNSFWDGDVILPYAPVRVSVTNNEAVAENVLQCLTVL